MTGLMANEVIHDYASVSNVIKAHQKLKEYLLQKYKADDNGDGYWNVGNADDVFEMGCDTGFRDALYEIGKILDISLPDKVKYDPSA